MTSALWFLAGFLAACAFSLMAVFGPIALGTWLARRRIRRQVRRLIAESRWPAWSER